MAMPIIRSVCVYCSSSNAAPPSFFQAAETLGKCIAENQWQLIYGGANIGLMVTVAKAAKAVGGTVTGIIPEMLKERELVFTGADEIVITKDMRERKDLMDKKADAFVILPGGFGTLEEVLEILTLKQLHQHERAIVFVNIDGFYNPLFQLFTNFYAHNMAKPESDKLYYAADSAEDAIQYLKTYTPTPFQSKWF